MLIGKDTRRSGYMLENALTAGLTSTGMNVLLTGPIPTPAVGYLTRSMRADLGIMISASHNPHHDNGIKFFGPDGFKLSDEAEAEIEAMLAGEIRLAEAENIGSAKRIDDGRGRYEEFAKSTLPGGVRLSGLKVVIDCANGAAYKCAPEVLWELGAEVIPVGVHAQRLQHQPEMRLDRHFAPRPRRWWRMARDIGISLDGDADRVMILDETGRVADGDQIMALLAARWSEQGRLDGRRAGGDGDVEPGAGAVPQRPRHRAGTHAGGRPLCGRADAGGGDEPRRRAIGPYRDDRFCHHRRRAAGGAAVPGGDGRDRQAGLGAGAAVRAGAADAEERPLCRGRRALGQGRRCRR